LPQQEDQQEEDDEQGYESVPGPKLNIYIILVNWQRSPS